MNYVVKDTDFYQCTKVSQSHLVDKISFNTKASKPHLISDTFLRDLI